MIETQQNQAKASHGEVNTHAKREIELKTTFKNTFFSRKLCDYTHQNKTKNSKKNTLKKERKKKFGNFTIEPNN